jgi:5-oxoprolinase (ATP-hydrolysing)
VLVPADAGLLSAVGLGRAVIERFAERQVLVPLDAVAVDLEAALDELAAAATEAVVAEGVEPDGVVVRRRIANLRFAGQDTSLAVECVPDRDVRRAFLRAYRKLYGYLPEARSVEVESLRVVASSRPPRERRRSAPASRRSAPVCGRQRCWIGGAWHHVPLLAREELQPGDTARGPAVVSEEHAATFLPPGWSLKVDGARALVLSAAGEDGDG